MLRNVIQSIEALEPKEISDNLAERRRALRIRSYCQVQLTIDGENYKGTVTDIGLDGLRVKSLTAPLAVGTEVAISYPKSTPGFELGVVRCQVLWCQRVGREIVAGVRYNDTKDNMRRSWVRYVLMELGFDEGRTYQRRRYIRVDGSIPARLYANDESLVPEARVVNLGIGGALVESREEVLRRPEVELEISLWRILPTLSLQGTILDVRQETGTGLWLTSIQFGPLPAENVKLLGNYIINLINQTSL